MKNIPTRTFILATASAVLAFGAVDRSCAETAGSNPAARYDAAGKKLERLRNLPDDSTKARQSVQALLSLARTAPPELSELVLEAACAGLIVLGDNSGYTKQRGGLRRIDEFEKEILDVCSDCGGTGRASVACSTCHGSGRCPIPNCNNGRRSVPKLGVVACSTCRGTGRCPDCGGNGKVQRRCGRCNGSSKRINREKARRLYENRVATAITICRNQGEGAHRIEEEKNLDRNRSEGSRIVTTDAKKADGVLGRVIERFGQGGRSSPDATAREDTRPPNEVVSETALIWDLRTSELSSHTFDDKQVAAFFDRDGGMTSVKKAKFEKEMFEKGLPQPWGARLLYHAIPNGTVFKVDVIYEKVDDNPDAMAIKLSLVDSEGYGWEYCNTVGNLPTTGSYYTHRGSDWPHAPWKKQDRKWQESFNRTCFPGHAYPRDMLLYIYRSSSSESEVEKFNPGTYLISKGWVVGLVVGNNANDRPKIAGQYMIFPSEDDALAFAHQSQPSKPAVFSIVPPRDKRDVLLAKLVQNNGNLVGLAEMLKAMKKHLDIQPGEALGSIVSECVGSSYFESLVRAARGNDKTAFNAELDATIRKLSELDDRCLSAAILEPGFDDYQLDLATALENNKDKNRVRKVRIFDETLWAAAHSSEFYKDYIRCAYQAFPDEVSFAVRDVKEGRYFWKVDLEAIVFDEIPVVWRDSVKEKWMGDKRQDRFFWAYMRERFGGGEGIGHYVLRLPKTRTDVEDWEPGKIITSDRWIRETLLENSVVTNSQNGREENTREVYISSTSKVGPTVLYTSLTDRLAIEKAASK